MKYLASSDEMQEIDRRTIEEIGISGIVLMERAACQVVAELEKTAEATSRFLIAIEGGNNGGDGICVARQLLEKGYDTDLYYIGGISRQSENFKIQLEIIKKLGIEVLSSIPDKEYDFIVDGIFGVGLSRNISGIQKTVIDKLNKMTGTKAAIDIPSGINGTTGEIMGTAFKADFTVTFGLVKSGMIFYPGNDYCGRIVPVPIGFPDIVIKQASPFLYTYEREDLNLLPGRYNDSNKGSYGRVSIIAGSKDISGAAVFAAKAAYRAGCGLVKIYTHASNKEVIASIVPEALMMTYNDEKTALLCAYDAMKYGDVLLIGPGIGTDNTAAGMLSVVMEQYKKTLIIDADGLNILSKDISLLSRRCGRLIITPHLKEMERLSGTDVGELKKNLPKYCRNFANDYNTICVLKDSRTCVSDGGEHVYVNTSGNNGMSTGGTGDVLAGIIAGFAAMGEAPDDAARLGVYVHGLAGDIAAYKKGKYSMMALDVAECISCVLGGMENE